MKEFHWRNFEWDPRVFPDPEGMLRRLKEKGLKICVWINPYIAQRSALFDEGMENGYLLKRPDGSVFQWDRWQSGMGLVDFTNPDAYRWYADKLRALVEMGVDCFKTNAPRSAAPRSVGPTSASPPKWSTMTARTRCGCTTIIHSSTTAACLRSWNKR